MSPLFFLFVVGVASLAQGDDTPRYTVVSDNETCLILSASITFNLTVNETFYSGSFDDNSSSIGSCDGDLHEITITANATGNETQDFTLSFQFIHDTSTKMWRAGLVTFYVGMVDVEANLTLVHGRLHQSYMCPETEISLGMDNSTTGTVTMRNFQVQPFGVKDDNFSRHVMSCSMVQPHTNNTVPIAVGAALGGLVLSVIVAYLIGRSRSNRRGYQAV